MARRADGLCIYCGNSAVGVTCDDAECRRRLQKNVDEDVPDTWMYHETVSAQVRSYEKPPAGG